MELEEAIRTRRTHKAYLPEQVDPEVLAEIFELCRWAPNHNLTNPWRMRVIGPQALERLKAVAGPEAALKLDRAPTLVVCSCVQNESDEVANAEDMQTAACAAYIFLLAGHARGYATYWRTPETLRTPEGKAAVLVPANEIVIALLHIGPAVQDKAAPERAPLSDTVSFLD